MIGRKLGEGGRYVIDRELGRGAMGAVYRAVDTRLESLVAVKVLFPHLVHNARLRERFRNEARVQAGLNHPNVVRATDWVDDGETLAVVMDYVEGPSLEAALAQAGGALAPDDVWAVLGPVLDAVAHAHAGRVVHRDLKPGNILLDRRATGSHRLGLPRVADFGIAKMLSTSGPGMTVAGTVMGTPAYMSPEQLRGWIDLDARADVYALGAIAYQLLTGRTPYGYGEDVPRAMTAGPPPPPSSLRAGVPPAVDAPIARALALDRDLRYADVAALKAALGPALSASGPAMSYGGSAPPPAWPAMPATELTTPAPAVPPRGAWAAAAAVVGVLAVAGLGVALMLTGADDASPAATEPARERSGDRSAPAGEGEKAPVEPAPPAPCDAAPAFEGHWQVNTVVLGTTKPSGGGVGVNGYYTLDASSEACRVRAHVDKSGYAKKRFAVDKHQIGDATLSPGWTRDGLAAAVGPLHLERPGGGASLDMELHLVRSGDELRGWWRYTGSSWRENGYWGVLLGQRHGSVPKLADADGQPCSVLCRVACGDLDGPSPPESRMGPCVQRCSDVSARSLSSVTCR